MELFADRETLQPPFVVSTADNGYPVLEVRVGESPPKCSKVDNHLVPSLIADHRELACDEVDADRDASDGFDVHSVGVISTDVAP